jgi:hypothetical protein
MEQMIAYCGLICTDCEAYIATQANDLAALEQMAARAREEFNMPDASAETAMCDGCLAESSRLCGYCYQCQVRACARERGMITCAHCNDYGCAHLRAFWQMAPQARTTLDAIRVELVA